ncbi:MAG TPA: prepilin-type cleavage/methylation domain-containing protein, partial [Methylomirabilota bacterium]|nr:prepilin-type cleavage/methylation domain-containing protein [Methylomirabilota bacterium]
RRLPTDLVEIGQGSLRDPWGRPYVYLNFAAAGPNAKSQMRKDRFLVPLNSTYDLYSTGKDGKTQPALTAKVSWDDVVRANDGGYVGLASSY